MFVCGCAGLKRGLAATEGKSRVEEDVGGWVGWCGQCAKAGKCLSMHA